MIEKYCEACGSKGKETKTHLASQIFKCNKCGLLWVDQSTIKNTSKISYKAGLENLNQLRRLNYKKTLDGIEKNVQTRGKGLEVGSAFGIFLEEAQKRGYQMQGIEPMQESFLVAKNKGLDVERGFFPEDVTSKIKYDFIVFNDVFEHIPDIVSCVDACSDMLTEEGFIIINLPISSGILFNLSILMDKLSISGPLERMWQFKTESPHLYYFSKKSIQALLKNKGYSLCKELKMETFLIKGLKKRIQAVEVSRIKATLIAIGLTIGYPIITLAPRDTCCYIFKKGFINH